jgi:hypothetical protein
LKPVIQLKMVDTGERRARAGIAELLKKDVLVGVPREKAGRRKPKVNNAMLAYIHDNGSPLAHIPPRPFMYPGIKNAQNDISRVLKQGASAALDGDTVTLDRSLHAAGLIAQTSIRKKIQEGPFTPLKKGTVAARRRRHPGWAKDRLKQPLLDSGQMAGAITHVVRDKTKS